MEMEDCKWLVLVVLLSLTEDGCRGDSPRPEVKTSLGVLRGVSMVSRGGREYALFTRIPYAEPPLGKLRFIDPIPAKPWTGIREASDMSPICYQVSPIQLGDEDCLYLNINTPKAIPAKLMPVIMYIHYGGFVKGFSGFPNSAKYFMDEDVVIVTLNYRLGILGFLSLETKEMPGNQGLKDAAMALEWVAKEIHNFGGNPNLITVMGMSAGAVMSHFICTAARTKQLVKGCISMSGSGSAGWAHSKPGQAREVALRLGGELGCPDERTIVSCLQEKPVDKVIVDSIKAMSMGLMPAIEAGNEGAMLTAWPPKDTNFPWLLGLAANEGILQGGYLEYIDGSLLKNYTENWKTFLPDLLNIEGNADESAKIIHDRFFSSENPFRAVEHLHSDAYFTYPALKDVSKHTGSKYLYLFNYTGGPTLYEYRLNKELNGVEKGVSHADDFFYYFDFNAFHNKSWPSQKDVEFSRNLIKRLVSFAKDQKPGDSWPQFIDGNYLYLGNDGSIIKKYENMEEILDFWDKIQFQPSLKYHNF